MKRVVAACLLALLAFAAAGAADGSVVPSAAVSTTATRTALTPDFNPTVAYKPVTFTAVVTSTDPTAPTPPTGSVQFQLNRVNQAGGLVAIDENGVATWTTSTLRVGAYSVTARYAGDANFSASTSPPLLQTVKPQLATRTAVVSSAAPAVWRQLITFSATVTPENLSLGAATGSVEWRIDGVSVGSASLDGTGVATLTTAALGRGTHTVVATFVITGTMAGSTSPPLSQRVNRAATVTVVTLTSPVTPKALKTYHATLSAVAPGRGIPNAGTVRFRIDGVDRGTPRPVINGVATWTTARVLSPGKHRIVAIYTGATNFLGSRSAAVTQQVK